MGLFATNICRIVMRLTDKKISACHESCFESVKQLQQSNRFIQTDRNVELWAIKKGIYKNSNADKQFLKTVEEIGELSRGLQNRNKDEIVDAIGDILVTLRNVAWFYQVDLDECYESAYNVISQRSGKMVDGVFVKDNK